MSVQLNEVACQQFAAAVFSWSQHDYHVTVSPQSRHCSCLYPLSLSQAELCLSQYVFLFLSVGSVVCVRVWFHATHYDTVLADVDIGTNLCRVDHAVLLDEDVVPDVQREERHSRRRDGGKEMKFRCLFACSSQKLGSQKRPAVLPVISSRYSVVYQPPYNLS